MHVYLSKKVVLFTIDLDCRKVCQIVKYPYFCRKWEIKVVELS